MNILVTGANGFIGRRLSARLIAQGHDVIGLSLKKPLDAAALRFKEYYQQDLSKPFSLKDNFDYVIHLAAYNVTHVGDRDAGLYTAINVGGTLHLLQTVKTRNFIYLSTTKVYKNEGRPLTENSPLAPQGAYAQSKLKAEEVCQTFLKKESLVIFRSTNVVGWGQAPKAVLPVFFQKAQANQALDILAAGAVLQFVYVEDLIDAIEVLISRKDERGVFNIAHEQTTRLEHLARAIITMTHSSSVLNVHEEGPETLFSPVICDKARRQLGWQAQTGITKILEEYARKI